MRKKLVFNFTWMAVAMFCLAFSSVCPAVTSKVVRHDNSAELLKGRSEKVIIGSRGTIQLGRAGETLVDQFQGFRDVWSINSLVISGGTVYFGTSPNGAIYKYNVSGLKRIYPSQTNPAGPKQVNGDIVEAEEHLSNEHIFALALDVAGRLLAGISGGTGKLCRFEGDRMEVIFEPPDSNYIFAIAVDAGGNIYLGTGPEGKIYKLDALGRKAELLYDSPDTSILSLAVGQDSWIYAGSDTRGLVYKINSRTKTATVLYDSDEPEITALLSVMNSGSETSLYAAATSAQVVQTQAKFAASTFNQPSPGRPEAEEEGEESSNSDTGGQRLEIANTEVPDQAKPPKSAGPIPKGTKPGQASHVYKITQDGFVTEVFEEAAVFFCLAEREGTLLLGTGNNAELFTVDPVSEQQAVIFEDEQAAQITAVSMGGEDLYLGTANPAKLVKLGSGFASEGTYTSDLIDAGQPANWGKLQLDADIPRECRVLVSARSGNVKDVNDPSFSPWSEPVEITEPVQLSCPLGRFCQYKLVLQSRHGQGSPVIREIAVASTVPNLAPRIASVSVVRSQGAGKEGVFKISYTAKDDNNDELTYKIDFRKVGRMNWIELKDEIGANAYEWDGKTVEDGRYEIRVTADDAGSNTASTALTGSRISEPVVVDNTGPVVYDMKITANSEGARQYRVFSVKATDELSAIGKLDYTIDSHAKWVSTVPDDLVYDTTHEAFTITVDVKEKLPAGEHILTIKVTDAVGNTTYKTFEINTD
ncbi:MAG: hypothetical protein JXM79_04210 [Sedimentisphaerales bacterium]|nr:hypothetical protein [Sedimentisphaerales bacterium]